MGYHGVHILRLAVKIGGLTIILVAVRVSFLVGQLRGVLFGIFLNYFAFFHRVPGAMHAPSMYFLHRPSHCSDGLHGFSCACQYGPSWGWLVRRFILPYAS